jgi:Icc-related predicted phosphoesterase
MDTVRIGTMTFPYDKVRIAAVADIHCSAAASGQFQPLFSQITQRADILLLAGDLTNYGLPQEAQTLAKEITASVKIPILAVLGNHDHESGKADQVTQILTDVGVKILDGDSVEVHGIGFAGVKGFGGGFGDHTLQSWGEAAIKEFVNEAVREALKLESALARLSTQHRIALLHYAPVAGTVRGEAPEIYAFLGSSRLEEPIDRYRVTAAFHGHAHSGEFESKTRGGTPVYNVALPVLQRQFPGRPAAHILEIPVGVNA